MKSNPDKMSIWDLKLIFDFSKVSQLMMSNKLHIFRNLGYAYKCTYCVSLVYFLLCVFSLIICHFVNLYFVTLYWGCIYFDGSNFWPNLAVLHHLISLGLYMMIYFFTYLCKIRHIQSMVWICMCLLVVLRFFCFVLNRTNITVHLTIHNRLTNLAIFCRFSLYKATFSITRYQL